MTLLRVAAILDCQWRLWERGRATWGHLRSRHGWVPEETHYEEMRALFESTLKPTVATWNEYHALLVRVGNKYCGPQPKCEHCPLKRYLPE